MTSRTRRQAGFSFIEILVVMGIISVLVSMVVFVVPMIQERTRRTKSSDNVGGLIKYYIADGAGVSKAWPPFNGKNFVLWLVAKNKIDRRDDKQLQILFSPGDQWMTWEKAGGIKAYEKLNLDSLARENSELLKLTSYAGRRNAEKEHLITSDEMSKGTLCICDDDDGPLHHKDGLVIGYVNGAAKFVDWDDLGMGPPADSNDPAGILGDQSPNDDLKHMSSQN
jgi:prepilin-type N-terminal cleavage/methylation domain-containing protein